MKKLPTKNNWNSFWDDKKESRFIKTSWSKKRIKLVLNNYLKPGVSVLDAGCGSGYFSNYFLSKKCKNTALDYSDDALKIAKRLTRGQGKFVRGDLLDENFCKKFEGKFDLIFSDGLFEHFKKNDQMKIIKNMKLMKSKNGVIITFVPNRFSFWEVIRPIFMPQIKETPFVLKSLIKLNEDCSLEIIKYGGLNVLPIKYSPEFFGSYFGMILYCIAK